MQQFVNSKNFFLFSWTKDFAFLKVSSSPKVQLKKKRTLEITNCSIFFSSFNGKKKLFCVNSFTLIAQLYWKTFKRQII